MPLPSYIAADFVAEAQAIVETLEGVYSAHAIDAAKAAAFVMPVAVAPAASATTPAVTAPVSGLYAAMKALWAAIPLLVSDVTGVDPSLPQGCLALARGLGQAMDPGDAAAAFALAADSAADPEAPLSGWTANRVIDNANAAILARLSRAVYLSPYVEALVTRDYATRADAITAKQDCVARFERELDLCGLGPDIAFADALTAMRDAAVDYLAQAIVNAKPVLTVQVPMPAPALVAAWRIYADPGRAGELIDRNGVRVAEFVQTTFEAMAA
jgi:hypothetical protein